MDMIGSTLGNIYNWEFMDEPLFKWFIFFGAMIAIATAWGGILAYMK